MRPLHILLIGEYSNVHWTLAQGLRALGHEATVVSDGDRWKNYRRDIDLRRRSLSLTDSLRYLYDVLRLWPRLRGYDVVQIINPVFLDLRAKRIGAFYRRLRRHNGLLSMGAFGMDHYWVSTCLDGHTFRYSDFNVGERLRDREPCNEPFVRDWLGGEKAPLNIRIAHDADCIVSGLYEYDRCYRAHFPSKTTFIPFPIDCASLTPKQPRQPGQPIRFFIGIQKDRSAYKGTDIMLRALECVCERYGKGRCEMVRAENVPYEQYERMLTNSDVLLDQLYGYTPAMNALMAMGKGLVVVGGGEEEGYELLGEGELRPVVNVVPSEESVYEALEQLVLHPERVDELSRQSVEYIHRHHDHLRVAQRYIDLWQSHLPCC